MASHESPFPAADSGTRDAAAPADGSASGIRVLIVDDKPAPLEVLQGLMQRLGFAAQTALGGEAALRALRSEPFDLMLLDLVMPVVDGHAVLDFCQRHGLATRTIVLSGDDSFAATRHALQCGAFDFVRKPYAVSALLATVERAVQQTELERENRRIASRLRDSEALHRFIVNSSPDLVYMVDRDGCFTFLNDRVESLLGYPKEALLGVRCDTLADAADRELARYVLNERRTGERASTNVEMRLCPRAAPGTPAAYSGASIWVEVTATGVYREAARGERLAYTGTYGTIRDITERKRTEASMSFRAHHDLLTRLPNRALLRDRLELAIAHAERNKGRIAVMFLDLDGFKHVNDTCGHATGDRLLQAVAARLRDCLRRGDTLARLGGDEFTLVSPEPGNDAGVRAIAEKILERLGRPFQVDGHNLQLGSSIGIATFPETGRTHDELLRNADAAMYQVKSGGKHGYCFFSPGMEPPSSMRPALQHELLEALSRNELEVFYQPQVCLRTGHVVGLESFVRWRHPQRGLLVADSFLPAIDDGALAVLIDRYALTRALHDAVGWLRTDARFQRLALNVSAASLRDEEAVDTLLQAVARARIDPATIVFELAEHELVREQDVLPSQLRRLRAAGMKITLDGFGLGYAPLTLLEDLPLDMLKLPGALTASISRDTASSQAVRAVLGMARALGARVVAEGVEYPYQLHYLAAQGCAEAQGHLLGAAVPAVHARKLLDGRPLPTWPLRDDAGTGAA